MRYSILISGAAQGIGAEIARVFYKQGYKVGIYDINESLAQELANDLGPNARAGYLDVSDYDQWQHKLKEFTKRSPFLQDKCTSRFKLFLFCFPIINK